MGSLCCTVLLFVVLIIGVNLFQASSSVKRYDLAIKAMESGRGDIAMSALGPEIGMGVHSVGSATGSAMLGLGQGISAAFK